MLENSKKPWTATGTGRTVLSVLLALVSLTAAGLLVHQWLTDDVAVGFGGDVQHSDPAGVSAPGPVDTSSLTAAEAWDAGDPGANPAVRGPETCGNLSARSRVCSPSIGIDAALESMGTDGAWNMAVPTHEDSAAIGWYSASAPIGGEQGNAVLAGHVDYPYDAPVLATLYTAQPGQKLWVSDGTGGVFSYTVTTVREPTPRDAPPRDIFELTGDPGLSLVTCSGDYVQPDGSPSWSYTNNLIVDLVLDPETAPVP
ncbi:class F sortase [Kocuria sp. CPCC 205292]|uniref:class F sortase n=1 Tax=Kocuria cellulosilytica TaxID=3071451 RepID=UPI0034D43D17